MLDGVLQDPTNLGRVLMELGIVSLETVKEAVMRQIDIHGASKIGEILIAMGVVTAYDLNYAVRIQEALRHKDELTAKLLVVEYQTQRIKRSVERSEPTAEMILAKLPPDTNETH